MSKEEWKRAEDALKGLLSVVRLKVDDYNIALILERVSTYKNAIMIYVNDSFQFQWMSEDCEERRRFLQRKERSLLNAKQKAAYNKLSKKRQKELDECHGGYTYASYSPLWTSFGSLKKHLITNNQQIELISINGEVDPA